MGFVGFPENSRCMDWTRTRASRSDGSGRVVGRVANRSIRLMFAKSSGTARAGGARASRVWSAGRNPFDPRDAHVPALRATRRRAAAALPTAVHSIHVECGDREIGLELRARAAFWLWQLSHCRASKLVRTATGCAPSWSAHLRQRHASSRRGMPCSQHHHLRYRRSAS